MQTKDFYIAAMSLNPDGGIYRFGLNANGVPEQREFTPLLNASYLAFSSDRRFFYATCAVAEGTGVCAAFRLEPSGSLVFLNQMPADGPAACHLTVAPSGKFLYCAN